MAALVAGALQAYRNGLLNNDEESFLDALLRARGTSLADADKSPEYRDALRGNLAVGRFLASDKRPREEILKSLRASATIETFPDLLPSGR